MSYLFQSSRITFDAAMRDLVQGSPKARAAAAHALGDLTDETEVRRATEALVRALEDDRMEVRAEACASLGGLDASTPEVVAAIGKRLADGSAAVRQNAAIALGTLRHADGFDPLAEALADGPADLRFQAVTSLAEIDPVRAYAPALAALGDADPQVVGAAALSLGGIGDARAVDAIATHLTNADLPARFDVAYALAELHDPRGRATLIAALEDADRAWDAATALGWLAAPEDIEALARALRAKKTPIEASVLAAGLLLLLAPDSPHTEAARKLLLDALGNRKTHVRGIAVEQLATTRAAWAIPALRKLSDSWRGAELRETIAAAIEKIEAT